MKDHGLSLNKLCACVQKDCPIWGNCVLCVQNHVEHGKHIPECLQDTLREDVKALAAKLELRTADGRPDGVNMPEDKAAQFVENSMRKHRGDADG